MAHQNKELDKMFFPVLTNLRNSKRKVKNIKGKIQLKYDYLNNFVFNDAFDSTRIK